MEVEGKDEEGTGDDEVEDHLGCEPGSKGADSEQIGTHQGRPAAGRCTSLPLKERPGKKQADDDHGDRGREANDGERWVDRLDEAPGTGRDEGQHDGAHGDGRQGDTRNVESAGLRRRRQVLDLAAERKNQRDDHDGFRPEHPAPTEVRGCPATNEGSGGGSCTRNAAEESVGDGSVAAGVVDGCESSNRRDDHRGADAFDDRPADEQHAEAAGQRCHQGADRVHDRTDNEGASPANASAKTRTGKDQGRHRQGERGDGQLHRTDGGVQISDDHHDGDVHHGAIDNHDEICQPEHHDRQPLAHGVNLPAVGCEIPGRGMFSMFAPTGKSIGSAA